MHKLAEAAGISIGSVVEIFHEDWGMRKLIEKWVPRSQAIDQRLHRVHDSNSYLGLFNRNPTIFNAH